MKSILFVTAFKEIGRESWTNIPRTTETYIEHFMNLANTIDYKLIVFVEESIRNILLQKNLRSNIILLDSSLVHTFYDEFLTIETNKMLHPLFLKKVSEDRKTCIEYTQPKYTLVNHSKINYVRWVKKQYPGYTFYSWLDFGCIRNTLNDVPKYVDLSRLEEKIIYLTLKPLPTNPISAEDMLCSHDVYLAGSQFIVHESLVETFEQLYRNKLEDWNEQLLCDEDQALVLQLYFENRDKFQLFHSSEWFSLFRNFLNVPFTPKVRNDLFTLMNVLGCSSGKSIEIGVARGSFSVDLLNNTKMSVHYCIDPYRRFDKTEYVDGMNTYDMDHEFELCKKNLMPFGSRVIFIRKTSSEAVEHFEDNSIDFVYIDGNHEYKYALQDMENYWKKVKPGGILAGDDVYELSIDGSKNVYKNWGYENSFGLYGVHDAVKDFAAKYNLRYTIFSNQFFILKV